MPRRVLPPARQALVSLALLIGCASGDGGTMQDTGAITPAVPTTACPPPGYPALLNGLPCPGTARPCSPSPTDPNKMECTEIDYSCFYAGAGGRFFSVTNCVGAYSDAVETTTLYCYGADATSCPPVSGGG